MKAQHVATQIAAMAADTGEKEAFVALAKRIFTEANHARILANLIAEITVEAVEAVEAPAPAPAPAPVEAADTPEMAMFRQFQAFVAMQNGGTVAPAPVQAPLAPAPAVPTKSVAKYLSPIVRKIDHVSCPCDTRAGKKCTGRVLGNGFCSSHGGKVDPNAPQAATEHKPR